MRQSSHFNVPSLAMIRQQSLAVDAALRQFLDQEFWSAFIPRCPALQIVAGGQSYYAALMGQYLLTQLAGVPTEVSFASEYGDCASPLLPQRFTFGVGLTEAEMSEIRQKNIATEIVNFSRQEFLVQVMFYYGLMLHCCEHFPRSDSSLSPIENRTRRPLGSSSLSSAQQPLLREELAQVPELLAKAIPLQAEAAKSLAGELASHSVGVILGRGLNYPLALAGSRLLQQTGFHALGYAGGEFHHGPKAVVREGLPIIAISPMGYAYAPPQSKVYPPVLKNALDMQSLGARIYGVASKDQKRHFQQIIPIPDVSEWQAPFLCFQGLQLLAQKMSA